MVVETDQVKWDNMRWLALGSTDKTFKTAGYDKSVWVWALTPRQNEGKTKRAEH